MLKLKYVYTRWVKYDRDKLRLVHTQIVPVIFEPHCIFTVRILAVVNRPDLGFQYNIPPFQRSLPFACLFLIPITFKLRAYKYFFW
jgi:hypothetical protein